MCPGLCLNSLWLLCSQVLLVPVLHVHHPLLLHLLRYDGRGCGAQHPGRSFPHDPEQAAPLLLGLSAVVKLLSRLLLHQTTE